MRNLEKTFIGKGEVKDCLFTQVAKTDHGFIYSVTFEDYENEGQFQKTPNHYEVFEKRIVRGYDFINNVETDELIECYPKSNNFGVWAFTAYKLDRAIDILNSF